MEKAPNPKRPFYRRPGCLVGLSVALILFIVGLVNAIASGGNGVGNTSDVSPTPTVVVTHAAVATPTPTPRSKPLSPEQRAVQLANNTSLFGKNVTGKFNAHELDMTEFIDVNGFLNNDSILGAIKSDCFNVFQSEYKNWSDLDTVDLIINATLTDSFGNQSTGKLAECTLTSSTEAHFNWSNLDYDLAWPDYDYTETPGLGS